MTKFNVGDKVLATANSVVCEGTSGVVTKVSPDDCTFKYHVDFDCTHGHGWPVTPAEIKAAVPFPVGTLVVARSPDSFTKQWSHPTIFNGEAPPSHWNLTFLGPEFSDGRYETRWPKTHVLLLATPKDAPVAAPVNALIEEVLGSLSGIVHAAAPEAPLAPSFPVRKVAGLTPQGRTILKHLLKRKTISPMEALTVYGAPRLAARILELRNAGYKITTDLRQDDRGHRYARYTLAVA